MTCPVPTPPANGQVSGSGNGYGDEVKYTCNAGYKLKGDPKRTCLADGTWDGVQPSCESRLLLNLYKIF